MKPFRIVRNALLMPLDGSMDAFASGIFDQGVLVPGSLQSRARAAEPCPPEQHLEGACIFGGYLFQHYGHFLLESLSRLYAIRQCREFPLLFMTPNDEIRNWQRDVFHCVGLKNKIILIKKPTRVETVIVSPEGSSVGPNHIAPEQIEALGQIGNADITPGKKVWLSRSSFVHKYNAGGIVNETEVETTLKTLGWEIVSPETLQDIRAQVQCISSAEYVAGFDGSAFFTTLLAREIKGHFIVFGRRKVVVSSIPHMLSKKNVSFEQHIPTVNLVQEQGAASLFFLPDIHEVVDVLRRF